MMHLSLAALLASCSAFAPKPLLRGTPRTARRQSLQMNVITDRPARAALAAAYVGFAGAIATFPGEFNNPADIQLIQDALNDPTSMTVQHKSDCRGTSVNMISGALDSLIYAQVHEPRLLLRF